MLRLRLAKFVLTAGLGLVCGCAGLSQCSLFDRLRARATGDPYNGAVVSEGAGPVAEGPMMDNVVPGGPPVGAIPSVTPENTIPSLTPPPRIIPQPQAQPSPYTP
jgi:hypothetical protein